MASSEELSRVFHIAPVALGLATLEGKLQVVNTAWETLMGFSAAELTSRSFFDFFHPDDIEPAKRELAHLVSGHTTLNFEARVIHHDGNYRWVQLSGRLDRSTNQIVAVAHEMVGATTEFTRAIVTAGPSAMFATDQEGMIVMANAPMAALFGYVDGELIGFHITKLVPERFRARHPELIEQFFQAGVPRVLGRGRSVTGQMKDGTEFSVEIGLAPFSTPRGQFVLGSVIDMSERERHSRDLIEHVSELRALQQQMEKAAELSSLLQHAATEHEVVRLAASLLPEVFPGRSGALYLQPPSRDALEFAAGWGDFDGPSRFPTNECWAVRLSRTHLSTSSSPTRCSHVGPVSGFACVPMMAHGQNVGVSVFAGGPTEMLSELTRTSTVDDISQALSNIRLRDRLRDLSIRDALTGLFNRRYLEETATREFARAIRSETPLSVLLLDVDLFKTFNDTHGHDFGDHVLREVGEGLQSLVRAEDVACRLGGEEFVIMLPGAAIASAEMRANTIRTEIRERCSGRVTISIGVAEFGTHGSTLDHLLRAADRALGRAKQNGRDRVEVANSGDYTPPTSRSPSTPVFKAER